MTYCWPNLTANLFALPPDGQEQPCARSVLLILILNVESHRKDEM